MATGMKHFVSYLNVAPSSPDVFLQSLLCVLRPGTFIQVPSSAKSLFRSWLQNLHASIDHCFPRSDLSIGNVSCCQLFCEFHQRAAIALQAERVKYKSSFTNEGLTGRFFLFFCFVFFSFFLFFLFFFCVCFFFFFLFFLVFFVFFLFFFFLCFFVFFILKP